MLDVLEVVDFLAESSKCVATWNDQEPKAYAQNYENRIVRFGKSDGPVLSIPTAVRGATDTWWVSFFSDQVISEWKISENNDKPRG
jgi:hypothetical protein